MTYRESYRDRVATIGQKGREIALATHLNSPIANETCSPDVTLSPGRSAAETKLAKMYKPRRPPTAGYNCFGHAFAMRRTAIFDYDRAGDIDRILHEDGFAPVSENEAAPGDVVLYSDEQGHTHAGRIDRTEPTLILPGSPITSSQAIIVLSKFDEFSGEYEHKIGDERWANGIVGTLTRAIYRDRHTAPRPAPGASWRAVVTAPSAP